MNNILSNRVWAEIDLDEIVSNYNKIKSSVNAKEVLCVIKADAYGHGSTRVAHALQDAGAGYFAVATFDEALELRQSGITANILLLGYFDDESIGMLISQNITISVFDIKSAKFLSAICQNLNKTVRVHIKVDTGMNRLGFNFDNAINDIVEINKMKGISIEGLYTHFAVADEVVSAEKTHAQFNKFLSVCDELEQKGIKMKFCHCANSGALLQYKHMHMDMVRAGIVLYGHTPDFDLEDSIGLIPPLTFKARVAQVKDVKKGESISYGFSHTFDRDSKIAVITIGYADGLLRACGGEGLYFTVAGKKAPVVGRICMDMCMIDLTDIYTEDNQICKGDEVVIFGSEENENHADDLAKRAGTITYEILCALSRRVAKIYKKQY